MGKRYYCEYCCRAFQDNLVARKKHLHSIAHIRKREEWYQNFKDKKTVLEENLKKKPCHKYLSTGSCPFANNCKYRHLNEKELAILKTEVETSFKPLELPPGDEIVQNWLEKRKAQPKEIFQEQDSKPSIMDDASIVPAELKLLEPLPPSLIPPPPGVWQFSCDDLTDWG